MKTIKDYLPGKKFIYGNKSCMVLDNTLEDGVLCIVLDENFSSEFGKNNNFARSTLREKLNGEYLDKWAESGAKRKDFVKMTVDLTADDGLKDYGTCECFLAPRTCEQHRKYRYLIPNASVYEWTATAYSVESNGYISIVRVVDADGSLNICSADGVYGVRPLFMLNHDCHFESEEEVAPVVHAKWENCDWVEPAYHGCGTIRTPNAGMKCTNCVHVFKKDLLWKDNYCPNCGAKMDLEDDE